MPVTDLLGADRNYTEGEAALAVAGMAPPADVPLILEALGLAAVTYRWDVHRVAVITLERCRHRREFSANTLHGFVPARARHLTARALTWMLQEHLAAPTGRRVPSAAPGARGRTVGCYRLTLAGERLSRDLAPQPGMDPRPMLALNQMTRIPA